MKPFLKIAYQPYKWLIVFPFVLIITIFLGLVCIFSGMVFRHNSLNSIAFVWAKLCCAVVPMNVIIKGKKNYDKNCAYVIVANHQSMADIPAIQGHINLNIKWIMKKELKKIPVFGSACHHIGCIYVDRNNSGAAIKAIERAKQRLGPKDCVLFFAEGTRSRDGKVMPFKKGAFKFAFEINLPILPVTIKNSCKVLPSDSLDLIPGKVEIIIHTPIEVSGFSMNSFDNLVEYTHHIISCSL